MKVDPIKVLQREMRWGLCFDRRASKAPSCSPKMLKAFCGRPSQRCKSSRFETQALQPMLTPARALLPIAEKFCICSHRTHVWHLTGAFGSTRYKAAFLRHLEGFSSAELQKVLCCSLPRTLASRPFAYTESYHKNLLLFMQSACIVLCPSLRQR